MVISSVSNLFNELDETDSPHNSTSFICRDGCVILQRCFQLENWMEQSSGRVWSLWLFFPCPWLEPTEISLSLCGKIFPSAAVCFGACHELSVVTQCKSVKGHYFTFNDNVIELKEPRIRNQGKKKKEREREKGKRKIQPLFQAYCFPRQLCVPGQVMTPSSLSVTVG